jgi:hypothetical protein
MLYIKMLVEVVVIKREDSQLDNLGAFLRGDGRSGGSNRNMAPWPLGLGSLPLVLMVTS